MERTNVWAKRAHSRDTRDSGDMKSEILPLKSTRVVRDFKFVGSSISVKLVQPANDEQFWDNSTHGILCLVLRTIYLLLFGLHLHFKGLLPKVLARIAYVDFAVNFPVIFLLYL